MHGPHAKVDQTLDGVLRGEEMRLSPPATGFWPWERCKLLDARRLSVHSELKRAVLVSLKNILGKKT